MSYRQQLEARWACREVEGGCGAAEGEPCHTFADGKPTQPHTDRWRQEDAYRWREDQRRRAARAEGREGWTLEEWRDLALALEARLAKVQEAMS